jgi:hypothetical protein
MGDKWLGLIGVIVGAVIIGAKELYFDWRKQRSNARYMAIRAVSLLDRYVDGCTAVVGDDGTVMGEPANQDGTCAPQADYPAFPVETLDGDWKSISQNLMYEILSFSNRIQSAEGMSEGQREHASPPHQEEYFEERQFQFARLGLKAHDLAKELRRKYGIPDREFGDWDSVKYLREQFDQITARREELEKRHQLQFASLTNPES